MSSLCRNAAQGFKVPNHFTSNVLSFLSPVAPVATGFSKHGIKPPTQLVIIYSFRAITTNHAPPKLDQDFLASPAVQETVCMLKGYGISIDDIIANPSVYQLPLNVIEQRLQYLAEGGIKTSTRCLTEFDSIASSSLLDLRSSEILKEDNIFDKMVSSVQFEDIPPLSISARAAYKDIHFQILNHVLNHKFGFSYAKWRRFFYASLQNTVQNIKVLRNMNLPFFWIQDHPTLTCNSSSNNLEKLLQIERTYLLPFSFNPLLRRDSDIAFADHSDFLAILFLLKKYKICRHDILKARKLDFFLIHPEAFVASMEKLLREYVPSDDNQLNLLYKLNYLSSPAKRSPPHFNWLFERRRNPLAEHRKEVPVEGSWQHEMKQWLDSKDVGLNFSPCLHSIHIRPKVELDADAQSLTKIKTTVNYLAALLGLSLNEVKIELAKLPNTHTVKVSVVKKTHKLLLGYGFSNDDIRPRLQLLLYPRDIVKETLDTKVFTDPVYGDVKFRSKHLDLCLYHILMQCNYGLHYS